MKHTLPSVETLKAEGCSAAIALMMHQMYAIIPDTQMEKDGTKDEKKKAYIENLVSDLSKVRNLEDFTILGEKMLLGVGVFDPEIPLEEQFKSEDLKTPEGARKYGKIIDELGLELPSWGDKDSLKVMWLNARIATGENAEKVHWELLKEDLDKDEKEGRNKRPLSAEEQSLIEKQRKYTDLFLHENNEVWHPVKRIARRLKELNEEHSQTTDAEWAGFEKEEAEFVHRFGLRGLRFPYAMSLKHRKEGMEDIALNLGKIATALEMPDHYIGFRGRMPVYYGGAITGSLGTYTHLTHTLYLLKDMGARATAHEWFHGLDYDLSYRTGNSAMGTLGGAPSFSETHLVAGLGPMKKVHDAMISLMEGVKYGFNGGLPVSTEDYIDDKGLFWNTLKNVYAKELFKWVPKENLQNSAQRFNFACQKLHSKEWNGARFTEYVVAEYENGMNLTKPEMKDRMLTDFRSEVRILSGLYERLREDKDFLSEERTSFLNWFCAQLDDKNGKQYYTIPTEFIARMGEQYVFDRLGEPLKEHAAPQYIMSFEKEKLQSRFADWVNEAKTFLAYDIKAQKKPQP